ncbi:MAG: hypothetical protein ABEJ93_05235 [Candidatus Nanohalobium sp.]
MQNLPEIREKGNPPEEQGIWVDTTEWHAESDPVDHLISLNELFPNFKPENPIIFKKDSSSLYYPPEHQNTPPQTTVIQARNLEGLKHELGHLVEDRKINTAQTPHLVYKAFKETFADLTCLNMIEGRKRFAEIPEKDFDGLKEALEPRNIEGLQRTYRRVLEEVEEGEYGKAYSILDGINHEPTEDFFQDLLAVNGVNYRGIADREEIEEKWGVMESLKNLQKEDSSERKKVLYTIGSKVAESEIYLKGLKDIDADEILGSIQFNGYGTPYETEVDFPHQVGRGYAVQLYNRGVSPQRLIENPSTYIQKTEDMIKNEIQRAIPDTGKPLV